MRWGNCRFLLGWQQPSDHLSSSKSGSLSHLFGTLQGQYGWDDQPLRTPPNIETHHWNPLNKHIGKSQGRHQWGSCEDIALDFPTILHRRGLGTTPFTMFLPPGYDGLESPRPVWGTGAPSQNLMICGWLLVVKFVLWNVQLQHITTIFRFQPVKIHLANFVPINTVQHIHEYIRYNIYMTHTHTCIFVNIYIYICNIYNYMYIYYSYRSKASV